MAVRAPVFEVESTLTDRYQTTVPDKVRAALKLGKRDRIHYQVLSDHTALISRASHKNEEAHDPVLGRFLAFLAHDIERNPQHLRALDSSLVSRLQSLVEGVEFDIDAPLPAE